ncbi:MAG: V-type ATP synthase subunit F [Candidatus Thermoplasmatota archaeon]|jgi:vacuolar-type H+-ATPase subunit F/Vma7|nr:V-type ATP synthase subunit F [Candidatus Thermoplasmatota archaeon]MDP7265720.1 V-type ATP synthase subunit F [Candidatus Thermoplasmatota archaeon]
MNIAVIGDKHTVQTFSLAGVKQNHIVKDFNTPGEIEKGFDGFVADEHISIIFLTERTAKAIDTKLKYHSELKQLYPLIIAIPDVSGESEEEDRVKVLIRRAVGVDIKEEA